VRESDVRSLAFRTCVGTRTDRAYSCAVSRGPQPNVDTTTVLPFPFAGVNFSVEPATRHGAGREFEHGGLEVVKERGEPGYDGARCERSPHLPLHRGNLLYTSVSVTARMRAGSRCSAVRTASQAAEARTASSVVVREYGNPATHFGKQMKKGEARPWLGTARIRAADRPQRGPPVTWLP
jgi:hypothetical protein